MNWAKILWWVVTNAPQLLSFIKQLMQLLKDAEDNQKTIVSGDIKPITIKSKASSTGKASVRARIDVRN